SPEQAQFLQNFYRGICPRLFSPTLLQPANSIQFMGEVQRQCGQLQACEKGIYRKVNSNRLVFTE
ncbi:hypothetical protein KI387_010467, partial [Taxus chinensis]